MATEGVCSRRGNLSRSSTLHPSRPASLPREVWIDAPAGGSGPRMIELPRDTDFVSQLYQTG
jgi:hypothetical protein